MSKCVKSTRRRSRRDGDDDNVAERFERIDEVGRAVADKKVSEGRDSRKEEDKAAVLKQAADVAKEDEEKEKAAAVRTASGEKCGHSEGMGELGSLFDDRRVLFGISVSLLLYGISSVWYHGQNLMYLASVAPILALPKLLVMLSCLVLGAAALFWATCSSPQPVATAAGALLAPALHALDKAGKNKKRGKGDVKSQQSGESTRVAKTDVKEAPLVQLSIEALMEATQEYGKELPAGVRVVAEYYQERYPQYIVQQIGPVCAAASVAGALNILNEREGAIRFCDVMQVYHIMFHHRRTEALAKLSKVLRVKDAESVINLFYDADICAAARARSGKGFLALVRGAITKAQAACEKNDALMAPIMQAISSPEKPASALVIDRLKKVAKAEWAIAKLEGRWPLPSGAILPSTAPVGNMHLSLAARALSKYTCGIANASMVRVESFMGLDAKCRYVVSRSDDGDAMLSQWEQLRSGIECGRSVLLYHLDNHYALICGWRELEVDCDCLLHDTGLEQDTATHSRLATNSALDCMQSHASSQHRDTHHQCAHSVGSGSAVGTKGTRLRQVLTARVGQSPRHWVDFDRDFTQISVKSKKLVRRSVRSTLVGWKGHQIMLLQKVSFQSKRPMVEREVDMLVARLNAGDMAHVLDNHNIYNEWEEAAEAEEAADEHDLFDDLEEAES